MAIAWETTSFSTWDDYEMVGATTCNSFKMIQFRCPHCQAWINAKVDDLSDIFEVDCDNCASIIEGSMRLHLLLVDDGGGE